jgi:hypothetical protein
MILAHERSSAYGQLLGSVRGLMFFATPHRGSDAAYWAHFAARLLHMIQVGRGTNPSFVAALQRNSTEFANISTQFIERAVSLRIRSFYETDRYLGELVCTIVPKVRLYSYLIMCKVVDKDSACLNLPNEIAVGVAGADHRTVCKFSDMKSQKYKIIWNAMKGLAEFALDNHTICT